MVRSKSKLGETVWGVGEWGWEEAEVLGQGIEQHRGRQRLCQAGT